MKAEGRYKDAEMAYEKAADWNPKIVVDGNLITGQNPWSTWRLAESMVSQLGYRPKHREKTDEENAVQILSIYLPYGK